MNNNVILQPITEVIPAGGYRPIYAYANFITILENSASNEINIGIGDMTPVPLRAGLQYELPQGDNFSKLMIYNQSAAETTVSLILSNGRVRDNRLTLAGEIPVRLVSDVIESPLMLTIGPVIAVALAPVAGQREVFLQNSGGYDIWFGDANVSPASRRGIKLTPDQQMILSSAATIYFKTDGGSSMLSVNRMVQAV